jgi:hypothetical protein
MVSPSVGNFANVEKGFLFDGQENTAHFLGAAHSLHAARLSKSKRERSDTRDALLRPEYTQTVNAYVIRRVSVGS